MGAFVVVADETAGLVVLDVSDPGNPRFVSAAPVTGTPLDLVIRDGVAYVALGAQGLGLYDVSALPAVTPLGTLPTAYPVPALDVAGTTVYLVQTGDVSPSVPRRVIIVDASNPLAPAQVGQYTSTGLYADAAAAYPYLYMAAPDSGSYSGGFEVLDVSDPAAPAFVARVSGFIGGNDVAVSGNTLYLNDSYYAVYLYDISVPSLPVQTGHLHYSQVKDLAVAGDYFYAAAGGVFVVDALDRTQPWMVGGSTTLGGTAVNVEGGRLFVAAGTLGFSLYDTADCGPCGVPSAPGPITVADLDLCLDDGVRVEWDPEVADWGDYSWGSRRYEIYRGTYNVASVAYGTTSFVDTEVYPNQSFAYTVRYVNRCGRKAPSEPVAGTDKAMVRPTITGNTQNPCPAAEAVISTQPGMTAYQWSFNGDPIPGANEGSLVVSVTGSYTVTYTDPAGCTGTSWSWYVHIHECAPYLWQIAHQPPQPVEEDGDGVLEAGEKWALWITEGNYGEGIAHGAVGSLQGEGIQVCNNPGLFGDLPPGGSSSYRFEFIAQNGLWYGTYPCGSAIGFDLAQKSSDAGHFTYPSDTNFHTQAVGAPGASAALAAADVSKVANEFKDAAFQPTASFASVISALLSVTLGGTTDPRLCVEIDLVLPGGGVQVVKPYGAAPQAQYDVTAAYGGAGAYSCRIREKVGCGTTMAYATATGIALDLVQSGGQCSSGASACQPIPGECAPGTALGQALLWGVGGKNSLTWPACLHATAYRLYRGAGADLPALAGPEPDSCQRYLGNALGTGPVLGEAPAPGAFYWYLLTGLNGLGEGPAGTGSLGGRILNASGYCP